MKIRTFSTLFKRFLLKFMKNWKMKNLKNFYLKMFLKKSWKLKNEKTNFKIFIGKLEEKNEKLKNEKMKK